MDIPINPTERVINALELAAAELERLRILKEHELGVRIEHTPDPNVVRVDGAEE